MKIVLDSNIIISAFASQGLCNSLFEYCLENHQIVICEGILKEIHSKLILKIKLPAEIVKNIISYLRLQTSIVHPEKISESKCRDINDLMVLGTAISVNADCIITGDKDLKILKKYQNIKILSPREFWELIKEKDF